MARYIDADKLIEELENDLKSFGQPDIQAKPIAYGSILGIESVLSLVKETPTADVVEVRHGVWVSCKNNSGYKCSNCGARIKNSDKFNGNHIWCHKCGARMDGGKNENV